MARGPAITADRKQQVKELHAKGLSQPRIAKETGMSQWAVSKILAGKYPEAKN